MVDGPAGATTTAVSKLLARAGIGQGALKDGVSGVAIELVSLVGTFVSFSLLGRKLGPSGYGSFASMYGLIGISITLSWIGPGLAMLQHAMGSTLTIVARHFLSLYLALTVTIFIVIVAISPLIVPGVKIGTLLLFLTAELVGVALVQISSTFRLIALGFRSTVSLQILPVVVKVFTIVSLFAVDRLTILNYGLMYMPLCLIVGITSFWRVTRTLGIPRSLGAWRASELRTTLTISVTIWAFGVHNNGDLLTMSALKKGPDIGLYAAGYRLVLFAMVPVNALVNSSYRSFLDPKVGRVFRRAIKYTVFTTIYTSIAAIGILLFSHIALPLIVGDGFSGAISISRWLALLLIVRGLTVFPMSGLMGLGRPGPRLVAIIISATVAMALYVSLIPSMSWRGAVIGSYCSDAVLVVVVWWMFWFYHRRSLQAFEPVEATEASPLIP